MGHAPGKSSCVCTLYTLPCIVLDVLRRRCLSRRRDMLDAAADVSG